MVQPDITRDSTNLLHRYRLVSVLLLCLVGTVMWVIIVVNQATIVKRVDTVEQSLHERTVRFDRIEQIEQDQLKLLQKLFRDKNTTKGE